MKNATTAARNLKSLLRKIGNAPTPAPGPEGPLEVLVESFLMWECTTERAATAYERIFGHVVDFNDLRVTMPHELVEVIGERFPLALERSQRLRAALRDIYMREHSMSLDRLRTLGKREVKKYMESLDGVVPYVSSRLLLLCFETHAVPVDDQLRSRLVEADVVTDEVETSELASWLARQIKATKGAQTHRDLQAWVDKSGSWSGSRSKKTTPASRKTTKKKTAKTGRSAATGNSAGPRKSTTKKRTRRIAGKA